MRILFCNYEYPPLGGGGGVINALLAEELAKRHQVTVLTSKSSALPADSVQAGVRILRVPVWFRRHKATANVPSMLVYVLRAASFGGRHLMLETYDVINTHFVLPSGPVGNCLAHRYQIPNVLSVHGGDLYDPSKIISPHRHAPLRMWIRHLVRRASAVVGQSTNTIANLHRYYTPSVDAHRIPLGISRPPDGRANRREYEIPDDDLVLVTIGRIVARKAIHQLLDMVHELSDLPIRLMVIGEGPELPGLREHAERLGIANKVTFPGRVDETEKFRLLRMSDLFVSTSQHEGFGLVFLEAMACGLPVICYNHGGQTDFLSDGVTGAVIPLNDQSAFAKRCRTLVEQKELRQRIGQENMKRVERYFIEHCAEQYEEVFQTVIDQHNRRR